MSHAIISKSTYRDHINLQLEPSLTMDDGRKYTIQCTACPRGCMLSFSDQRPLSFAAVGKIGGQLCLLCKRLASEAKEVSLIPSGQHSLIYSVEDDV